MRYFMYILVLSTVLLCSCSDTDDTIETVVNETAFPDFSFINFSSPEAVLQYQFDVPRQMGDFFNITISDGVIPAIQRVYESGDVVGMYSGNQVWLKNLSTGSVVSGMNFFSEGDDEIRNWTINSESIVFSGFHDALSFDNFIVRVIDLDTNIVTMIPVGNIGQTAEAVFRQDHLIFYENGLSENGDIQSKLVIVSINAMESLGIQLFENRNIIGTVFGESNDVFVFYNDNTYTRFDITSFTALDSGGSSLIAQLNGSEVVNDSKIYFVRVFPEPTVLDPLPAIYDITSQETTLVDITPALTALAEENEWNNLEQTTIDYSLNNNAWLIGYRYTDAAGTTKGGVAKFSNDAELLANIEVTDFPWNLVVLE